MIRTEKICEEENYYRQTGLVYQCIEKVLEETGLPFRMIRRCVDEILLLSDREIGEAVLALLPEAHILTEPSGAASLATLLFR